QPPPSPGSTYQAPPSPGSTYQPPPPPGSTYQAPPSPGSGYAPPPSPGSTYQLSPTPSSSYQAPPAPGSTPYVRPSYAGSSYQTSPPPPQPRPWGAGYTPPSTAAAAQPAPPWARAGRIPAAETPAVGGVLTALGGGALVIGAFLAWISATYQGTTISQRGIDTPSGDGWFFVAVGITILAAGVGTLVVPNAWLGLLAVAGAVAAAGVTVYEFADVHGHISDARAALGQDVGSYGPGLYILAGASLLILAGGIAESVRGRGR
ncbi:MAG TPA: hypothetical protein VFO60_06160, partial [Candidatus Dormibacteraeota bacterium]|nr:hypothetical protein [Candidatus Dormibacteraeota bacterium]